MQNFSIQDLYRIPSLFVSILDCSYNGIVIIDSAGIVVVYNQAAVRMLLSEQASPVGRHFSEILPYRSGIPYSARCGQQYDVGAGNGIQHAG